MMKAFNSNKSETVTDPVCGMEVKGVKFYHSNYQDKTFYFCSQHCQGDFENHPDQFLGFHEKKKKSLWGRYLERLKKITSGSSIKCH